MIRRGVGSIGSEQVDKLALPAGALLLQLVGRA